jgi:hypothetical protein
VGLFRGFKGSKFFKQLEVAHCNVRLIVGILTLFHSLRNILTRRKFIFTFDNVNILITIILQKTFQVTILDELFIVLLLNSLRFPSRASQEFHIWDIGRSLQKISSNFQSSALNELHVFDVVLET